MALLVWLPFTQGGGEISNQGLSDLSLTGGTPSYTDSPLMKALSLKTKKYFTSSGLTQMKNSFTIMFFAKNTGTSADYVAFTLSSGAFTIYQTGQKITFQDTNTAIVTSGTLAGTDIDTSWHHICVRCDGTYVKTFVDGVEKASTSYQSDTTKQASFTKDFDLGTGDSTSPQTDGICDFRVYDEPISLKLIKNISKGMIYHYSLDNYHGGPENYALGTNTTTVNWSLNEQYIGWASSTYTDDSGVVVTKLTRSSSGNETGWNVLQYNKINVSGLKAIPDTDITVSFDFRCSKPTGYMRIEILTGGGVNPIANYAHASTGNVANKWVHIKATLHTVTSANMPTSGGQVLYITNIAKDAGAVFEMKNLIIVKGNADVPWHPAPSDAFYTALGFNSNTIPDESGLGEDAIGTGNSSEPVSKSGKDFPTNNIAAYLDGKSYFYFPTHFTTGQQVSQLSLACYVYITSNNNIISLGGNSFIRFRPSTGGTEILYTDTTGSVIANKTVPGDIGVNKWRHVCITYKDGIFKQYLDGVLAGTLDATANGKYMTCGENITGYIGCYIANSETMTGYVSDVRIYGTCLDATDVANLYQSVAHITNMGDMVINGQLIEEC